MYYVRIAKALPQHFEMCMMLCRTAEKARYMHCHFSKIEYSEAGEKRHLTFADTVYGPSFEPLAEALVRDGLCPRIISESAGTQSEDALAMQLAYTAAKNA